MSKKDSHTFEQFVNLQNALKEWNEAQETWRLVQEAYHPLTEEFQDGIYYHYQAEQKYKKACEDFNNTAHKDYEINGKQEVKDEN